MTPEAIKGLVRKIPNLYIKCESIKDLVENIPNLSLVKVLIGEYSKSTYARKCHEYS